MEPVTQVASAPNVWVVLGALAGVFSLALAVLVMFLKLGRLIGTITEQVRALSEDTANLWKRQRMQDDRCALQMKEVAAAVATGNETARKLDDIYRHLLKDG